MNLTEALEIIQWPESRLAFVEKIAPLVKIAAAEAAADGQAEIRSRALIRGEQ